MKKHISKNWQKLVLLGISLSFLTACGTGIKDGTYRDENGYILTVTGKEVELNALIATGTGRIQGNSIDIDTSVLGISAGNQTLTYKRKGKNIEVTDENGNVMLFEPVEADEVNSGADFGQALEEVSKSLLGDAEEVIDAATDTDTSEVSSSSKQSENKNKSSKTETETKTNTTKTEVAVTELAGIWENGEGDRWEITSDGFMKSSSRNYRFEENKITESGTTYGGAWTQILLNGDGSKVEPNSMAILYKPAGLSASGVTDKSDTSKERFYIANNGGDTWFQDKPSWIFYKVEDEKAATAETKNIKLSDLAGTWKSEKFGTLVIDDKGYATKEDGTPRWQLSHAKHDKQHGVLFDGVGLNEDGSKQMTGGASAVYISAGSYGTQITADKSKEKLYFTQDLGTVSEEEVFYYRVSDKTETSSKKASSDSTSSSKKDIWNADKSKQLAQFMVDWGKQMGQPDYQEMVGKYALLWKGNGDTMMDVTFDQSGVSSSEYTVVAAYQYLIDGFTAHRYYFAIKQDGSPAVLYSNNGRSYSPYYFDLPDDYESFVTNVIGETENQVLKDGFAAIVKGEKLPDLSQLNPNHRWDESKASQLAQFMVTWGNQMGQPGYVDVYWDHPFLRWKDSTLDVTYHSNGISDSDYTIVAAYEYDRGGGLYHRYHFAIMRDGSTSILYSEVGSGNFVEISKLNTANTDLQNGFANIVNP